MTRKLDLLRNETADRLREAAMIIHDDDADLVLGYYQAPELVSYCELAGGSALAVDTSPFAISSTVFFGEEIASIVEPVGHLDPAPITCDCVDFVDARPALNEAIMTQGAIKPEYVVVKTGTDHAPQFSSEFNYCGYSYVAGPCPKKNVLDRTVAHLVKEHRPAPLFSPNEDIVVRTVFDAMVGVREDTVMWWKGSGMCVLTVERFGVSRTFSVSERYDQSELWCKHKYNVWFMAYEVLPDPVSLLRLMCTGLQRVVSGSDICIRRLAPIYTQSISLVDSVASAVLKVVRVRTRATDRTKSVFSRVLRRSVECQDEHSYGLRKMCGHDLRLFVSDRMVARAIGRIDELDSHVILDVLSDLYGKVYASGVCHLYFSGKGSWELPPLPCDIQFAPLGGYAVLKSALTDVSYGDDVASAVVQPCDDDVVNCSDEEVPELLSPKEVQSDFFPFRGEPWKDKSAPKWMQPSKAVMTSSLTDHDLVTFVPRGKDQPMTNSEIIALVRRDPKYRQRVIKKADVTKALYVGIGNRRWGNVSRDGYKYWHCSYSNT